MKQTTQSMNIVDMLIVTVIFFGMPIYTSLSQFFLLQEGAVAITDTLTFTDQDNIWAILIELISLAIAAVYLKLRRFDFTQLTFSFNAKAIVLTAGIILIAGSLSELYFYLAAPFQDAGAYLTSAEVAPTDTTSTLSFYLVLFSLLNGFFEEVFFLGLIFAVNKKALPYAIVFSLVIRFLFHTYQGMFYAVNVLLFGIVLLILRSKIKNLLPFTLAHAFFDVFGLGLLPIIDIVEKIIK
ncbi:permease [Histophilus somni]|uniref:CPBP family intramembrane metalloprotease n=1 Tax=Histophilus somni TaxID=731 RepID=A0A9Q6Z1T7_HISSO|nr:CPBP family intramembrane glutamic endopeptidase [Histophilus somni]ARU64522.1 permease [Histophilus somni]ARU66307.1 permease [Histophilus somni]ARU68182.1 permease [Histophilus somni]ARU70062.1 permease [Histophilus somni]ARU71936.1 permease [Histophilus somni]